MGNVSLHWVLNVTLTPASVAGGTTAGSSAEQTFTCVGVRVGDFVSVNKPTTQAGLVLGNARASAAGVIGINFGNLTSTTITPTAGEVYTVYVARFENYAISAAAPSGTGGP
jgi:hypothetical protein